MADRLGWLEISTENKTKMKSYDKKIKIIRM
jgi:hypothetical protein